MAEVSFERVYAERGPPASLETPTFPEKAHEVASEAQRVVVEKVLRLESAKASHSRDADAADRVTTEKAQYFKAEDAELLAEYEAALEAQRSAVEVVLRSVSTKDASLLRTQAVYPVRDVEKCCLAPELDSIPGVQPVEEDDRLAEDMNLRTSEDSDIDAVVSEPVVDEAPTPLAADDPQSEYAVPPAVRPEPEATEVLSPSENAKVDSEGVNSDDRLEEVPSQIEYLKLEHFYRTQFKLQNAYEIPMDARGDFRAMAAAIEKAPGEAECILETSTAVSDYWRWSKSSALRLDRLAHRVLENMNDTEKLRLMGDVGEIHDNLVAAYAVGNDTGALYQAILQDNTLAKSTLKTEYPCSRFAVMKRARNAVAHANVMKKVKNSVSTRPRKPRK
jgi:hypothetical protein